MADYSLLNWFQSQQRKPYLSTPQAAAGSPDVPAMIGADYEQMPAYMPAYSAVNAPLNVNGAGSTPGVTPDWLQSMRDWGVLGSTDKNGIQQQGWGGLALGAAQGLGSLYLGMQQYQLAKDTLANNKAQFERNFAAQKATTNASLEDRQRARVASNPGAYQSVGDYMAQNGVR
jgi:hypothetical protein